MHVVEQIYIFKDKFMFKKNTSSKYEIINIITTLRIQHQKLNK